MVIVVYGTTGELIKLLPLLKSLKQDDFISICTYQQPQQLKQLFAAAGIEGPTFKIGQSEAANDLERITSIPGWFLKVIIGFWRHKRAIRRAIDQDKRPSMVLVHGDTLTTVLGAMMGKLLGLAVGHVEAGLRSYNWRHPFPEEIDRILTSKLARVHFSPGQIPVDNLRQARTKGVIINTTYNTVLDSLRLAQKTTLKLNFKLPKTYGIVSIHRNELLARPSELKSLLDSLKEFSRQLPLVFLDHPVTQERLKKLKLDQILAQPGIIRLPKLSYFEFIQLLSHAECVITDSGGLQEEAAYLGIPCLVHRRATERQEGLGKNVELSLYDEDKVKNFIAHYPKYKTEGVSAAVQPTATIVKYLRQKGYI